MGDQENNIVISLLRLGAFLVRTGNRLLRDYDLNQQQFVVLGHIKITGPVSQKDICSGLLHEKSNVSKIVKKLEKLGMVEKRHSSDDSRITLLKITGKGNKTYEDCMYRFDEWNNNWLKSFKRKEVSQAVETLRKLESKNQV